MVNELTPGQTGKENALIQVVRYRGIEFLGNHWVIYLINLGHGAIAQG